MSEAENRIRQARRSAVLSQSALAERVGVHRSAVAQWESVGGSHPTMEHSARIALATEVSIEWLVTGRGRMKYASNLFAEETPPAVLLNICAQSEIEERALAAMRKLDVAVLLSFIETMEVLSRSKRPFKVRRQTAYCR